MNSTFDGQILVEKLAKLTESQPSIETLSHWCIFHRNNAKQVVETWDHQFHRSHRDQRVSFLYLANDILQKSRRKGVEFIYEFLKVLPGALHDVYENGGEFGRKAVLRLVDIWEERKVFGSYGRSLKEELVGSSSENRNGTSICYKLKQPSREMLEKIISSYERVCNVDVEEDALFGKCQTAISFFEKVEKEGRSYLGNASGSMVAGKLQMQHGMLRECLVKLKEAESSRSILVALLRVALHEQELKVEQMLNQIKAAHLWYKQATIICQRLVDSDVGYQPLELNHKESSSAFADAPPGFDRPQLASVSYTQGGPLGNSPSYTEGPCSMKLMASSSSSSVDMSSSSSDGAVCVGHTLQEDHALKNKKPRLDAAAPFDMPPPLHQLQPQHQLAPPTFLSVHQPPLPSQMANPGPNLELPPPPPAMPPPPTPPPPTMPPTPPPIPPPANEFMQDQAAPMTMLAPVAPVTGISYGYGPVLPQGPPPMPFIPTAGLFHYPRAGNPYHNFPAPPAQGMAFYGQPSFSRPPPPMTQQRKE